ncbi:unnamed protein product [Psylliodes chrysocephalus]|uniref:Uncharacterized protein n=1 Tax=Psylliodes chrysocephalus TaxID=3402493 RepID=A0A9P0D4C3_9CUCU|nr:unnamed protein product [Psylliodes chrysocephala]
MVCQKAFLSLFRIGIKRLKRLKGLLKQNITPYDKRGQNVKGNVISEENNVLIRQNIELSPVKETHYSNKSYLYLDGKLNMKIMVDMFKVKYSTTKIRYSYFVIYFYEHFDIHFGRSQVDTCCKCEELDLKIKSPLLGDAAKRAAAPNLQYKKEEP